MVTWSTDTSTSIFMIHTGLAYMRYDQTTTDTGHSTCVNSFEFQYKLHGHNRGAKKLIIFIGGLLIPIR